MIFFMRTKVVCVILAALLCCALPALAEEAVICYEQPAETINGLEIRFLDIGLGDSFFMTCGGETMLIDGGTEQEAPRLKQYFTDLGIDHFTYIVNTHSHDDHIGGLTYLLKKGFSADTVISPYRIAKTEEHHALFVKQVRKLNIAYRTVADGDTMMLGDAEITFFRDTEANALLNRNDNSLVMLVRYGDRTVLLLADIGGRVERYFAEKYGDQLHADIVKSMHHGINLFVRELVDAVQPSLVVCTSSAKRVPEFVKQMEKYGLNALYASDGIVYAVTDGASWYVWQGGHMNKE